MQTRFDTMFDMCKYLYKNMKAGETASETMIIHGESLPCHIYRIQDNYIFDSQSKVTSLFSLCTTDDTATQVVIGNDITISSYVNFRPPYRCRGMVVYCNGTMVNNGYITMTSRGCVAVGQDIYLYKNRDNTYEYVPAQGAAGGYGYSLPEKQTQRDGYNGSNGTDRRTGGGGSGAGRRWVYDTSVGRGGYGTSFSGGAGSGASHSDGHYGWAAHSAAGADNGGAGSNGIVHSGNQSGASMVSTGGQGNPNGGWESYLGSVSKVWTHTYGTGGLLILFCKELINRGNIESFGGSQMCPEASVTYRLTGGGSGGGSINIFYTRDIRRGSASAVGGGRCGTAEWYGGNGGDGCVTYSHIGNLLATINCTADTKYIDNPGDVVTITFDKIKWLNGYKQTFVGLVADYDKVIFKRVSSNAFTFTIPNDVLSDLDFGGTVTVKAIYTKLRTNSNYYKDTHYHEPFDYNKFVELVGDS